MDGSIIKEYIPIYIERLHTARKTMSTTIAKEKKLNENERRCRKEKPHICTIYAAAAGCDAQLITSRSLKRLTSIALLHG